MKYSGWNKRPQLRPEMCREFTLKSDGSKISLSLRKLGTVQNTQVYELTETLVDRFVKGDAEWQSSGGKSGEGPLPFPPVGGEQVQPTESMIQSACFLHVMNAHDPDAIEIEDWIAFQIVEDPADWSAIQKFATEVNRLGKSSDPKAADVPNASGAVVKISSVPSSTSTDSTQN